jgi:hypothetical protein
LTHKSILAHLAPLLTNQIENVATDALAHLLLQYDFILNAFREYISSTGIAFPDDLAVKTQARWQDAAIPDLVGLDKDGRHLLIVESKFWASLTSNQPATYIERLPHDRPAILLFIAPVSRLTTLWPELLRRCNPPDLNSQNERETTTEKNLTTHLNSMHILALISWESLLAVLYENAQQVGNNYAMSDIWQLQSLCTYVSSEAFLPLTPEEIISPIKKRIEQLRFLIDELVNRLIESDIASIEGYKATLGPDYYKRYMSIHNIKNWCIEFNEHYRRQYPSTLLWLTNTETPTLSRMLRGLSQKSCKYGSQILIPLKIPIQAEREEVLTSLFQQILEVSKILDNP